MPSQTAVIDESVVVIGAGFGGLATACYLATAGADVTVLEKNEQLGGRASQFERDGFTFDMGPSWYLMPDVFERFFGHFDRTPEEFYTLEHLDPHYRIFFKDTPADAVPPSDRTEPRRAAPNAPTPTPVDESGPTDVLDAVADTEHMKRVFESYEPGAGQAFERYLNRARETYERGMRHFVYVDRPRFRDYLDLDVIRNARGLRLLGSMDDHVAEYFEHPKLRQVVQYSLVFLGGSPSNTPALYNLMSHVDFELGVYYPDGGFRSVVDGMVELATDLGVTFQTDREVTQIDGSVGSFTVSGNEWSRDTDIVVSNTDIAHTEQSLLSPSQRQFDADYWSSATLAPSAFLLFLGVTGEVPELSHHSLVLPSDWKTHFRQIFDQPAWPDDPAYYLCVPSRTDDTVAPAGHSALFVLVPIAPGLPDDIETREWFRDRILNDIAENTGVSLHDRIVVEEHFSVSDFAARYNSLDGTALGLAHTLRQTGPLRPDHRSTALDGLYFVGANTRPGIGVPMCLIGGEHTAAAIIADRCASAPPWGS